ncbi:MAG: helix-turn-helix domain-containing protein [Acidimicrobiia bacterium]
MDVGRPGAVVLPAGTEAVLRALAGTDAPMGVRHVARVAGVSPNRAGQVLSRLAEHGLVLVEEHGAGRLCRLNRSHLATDAVVALVDLRGRLINFLRDEVAAWARPAGHVSLFGSAARGDGDTSSDLDILVIRANHDDEEGWEGQLYDSGERIVAATGNRPAWFTITIQDLGRAVAAGEPIVAEWQRDGLHLAGQRLGTLLRRVA